MSKAKQLLAIEGSQARWSLADYESELRSAESRLFELPNSEQPWGFVLFREFPDGIEIMNLAVSTEMRGRGLGRELLQKFLESLKSGVEVRLEVSSTNAYALRVYEKIGFAEYHRRKAYYKDGSDALLMRFRLSF